MHAISIHAEDNLRGVGSFCPELTKASTGPVGTVVHLDNNEEEALSELDREYAENETYEQYVLELCEEQDLAIGQWH